MNNNDHITDHHIVTALQASRGVLVLAAQKLNISRRTLSNWINDDPTLKAVLMEIREETLDLAEGQLYKLIASGDRESIRFYLRCFGKARGWVETTRVEGPGGGPVLAITAPASMTQEAFAEIAKQLSSEI